MTVYMQNAARATEAPMTEAEREAAIRNRGVSVPQSAGIVRHLLPILGFPFRRGFGFRLHLVEQQLLGRDVSALKLRGGDSLAALKRMQKQLGVQKLACLPVEPAHFQLRLGDERPEVCGY